MVNVDKVTDSAISYIVLVAVAAVAYLIAQRVVDFAIPEGSESEDMWAFALFFIVLIVLLAGVFLIRSMAKSK